MRVRQQIEIAGIDATRAQRAEAKSETYSDVSWEKLDATRAQRAEAKKRAVAKALVILRTQPARSVLRQSIVFIAF